MNDWPFLFDTNVWIALTFNAHPGHQAARRVFSGASRDRPACFCRATQQSVLRLASTDTVTHKTYGVPMTNADALRTFEGFLSNPHVSFRVEPAKLESLWPKNAALKSASPKVWMDAYLAAFAIAGELTLATFDGDFKAYEKHGLDLLLIDTK